jgi:hypothetical protein
MLRDFDHAAMRRHDDEPVMAWLLHGNFCASWLR